MTIMMMKLMMIMLMMMMTREEEEEQEEEEEKEKEEEEEDDDDDDEDDHNDDDATTTTTTMMMIFFYYFFDVVQRGRTVGRQSGVLVELCPLIAQDGVYLCVLELYSAVCQTSRPYPVVGDRLVGSQDKIKSAHKAFECSKRLAPGVSVLLNDIIDAAPVR
jgi:hypothetical protein